ETKRADKAARLAKASEEQAKAQTKLADSRRLAALVVTEMAKRLDRALILGAEALQAQDTLEARSSLLRALNTRPGLITFFHLSKKGIHAMDFSPNGKVMAVACSDSVVLWDLATRRRLIEKPLDMPEGGVFEV